MDTTRQLRTGNADPDLHTDEGHTTQIEPAMLNHYWQQGTYPMEMLLEAMAQQATIAYSGYTMQAVDSAMERILSVPYGSFKEVQH